MEPIFHPIWTGCFTSSFLLSINVQLYKSCCIAWGIFTYIMLYFSSWPAWQKLILVRLLPLVLWLSRQRMAFFFVANCELFCTRPLSSYQCFARLWEYVPSMDGFYILLHRLRCITRSSSLDWWVLQSPSLPQRAGTVPFDSKGQRVHHKGVVFRIYTQKRKFPFV